MLRRHDSDAVTTVNSFSIFNVLRESDTRARVIVKASRSRGRNKWTSTGQCSKNRLFLSCTGDEYDSYCEQRNQDAFIHVSKEKLLKYSVSLPTLHIQLDVSLFYLFIRLYYQPVCLLLCLSVCLCPLRKILVDTPI